MLLTPLPAAYSAQSLWRWGGAVGLGDLLLHFGLFQSPICHINPHCHKASGWLVFAPAKFPAYVGSNFPPVHPVDDSGISSCLTEELSLL